jgi:GT2 family glycosyltransferase
MEASFVIPLHNCLGLTRACLASLRETIPPGVEHEIILVDDASIDGTAEWLLTLPTPCRALRNDRNLGFAVSCNRGAAAARGSLLFFLNSDLVLLPGWFAPLQIAIGQRPEAGLVGNVQRRFDNGAVDHTGIRVNYQGKPVHDTHRTRGPRLRPVPAVTGACFAIRAELWRELGGFDEGFFNGGEDVDLGLRAGAGGRTNFVALDSVVRHHVSRSPGRKSRDEENSRRLASRWRQTLASLAASDWCRHYLAAKWTRPGDPEDYLDGACACLHVTGLRKDPGDFARRGAQRAIEVELARWRHLFDGAPETNVAEPAVL